jgi:hypothetical protein
MKKLLSGLVTVAIAAALVVVPSAASARPIDAPGVGATQSANAAPDPVVPAAVQRTASGANPVAQTQPIGNSPSVASASSGFQWGDAGIGAAAMLVFLTIAGGTVLSVRRSLGRGQPAPIG